MLKLKKKMIYVKRVRDVSLIIWMTFEINSYYYLAHKMFYLTQTSYVVLNECDSVGNTR